ncbi:LysR family transcriptional regulator [Moritella sp. Urea-trap-13]|uniref:LysR family transcriptional regulator n=1 Tax=Moritella sp. Urea-trap-13 TaxID=2058327 RepID=UPI000C337A66|nr:LysR family transcriptional regulator [Moritella sp. Urea-trap-13]PKH04810.1 hypothetical protein CXF93_21610 [Moritella sp. Urea-trap-13]
MRIEDLKLFVQIASHLSLREAALHLNMQPGTLSKVVRRVESYYQQALFVRIGKGWQLSPAGKTLLARSNELLNINHDIELELGQPQRTHMRISGADGLLNHYLPALISPLQQYDHELTLATFKDPGVDSLLRYQVDLALVATNGEPPQIQGIQTKLLDQVKFVLACSPNHPLAKRESAIPITEILEYGFIVPSSNIYGDTGSLLSNDGWHDEAFARRIVARVDTISALASLLKTQHWLAYIPEYLLAESQLSMLKSHGCPYTCNQFIWLCCQQKIQYGWINRLF